MKQVRGNPTLGRSSVFIRTGARQAGRYQPAEGRVGSSPCHTDPPEQGEPGGL